MASTAESNLGGHTPAEAVSCLYACPVRGRACRSDSSIQGGYVMLEWVGTLLLPLLFSAWGKRGHLKKPCASSGGTTWADASGTLQASVVP